MYAERYPMKRDATGKFVNTWNLEAKRHVSVTLTTTAWQLLEEEARKLGISRSEVIERTARSFATTQGLQAETNERSHQSLDSAGDCMESQESVWQQQTIAELQHQKQPLETLIENVPDIILRFDLESRYAYISPSVERVTGLQTTAFIGKTNVELGMPEAVCQAWGQGLEQVFATKQEQQIELQLPSLTGKRWYQARLVPEFAENGSIVSVLGIARDIDQAIHSDDRDRAEQNGLNAAASHTDSDNEFQIVYPDGSARWIATKGGIFYDSENRPLRMIGIDQDITERNQLEVEHEQLLQQLEVSLGQFEAVINSMSEGLIVGDAQGNILLFNPAALALHEYDAVEQVQRHLYEFADTFAIHDLQGNLVPLAEWPLARILNGETYRDYELQIHRLDNGKGWIGSYSGTPVYDKRGQLVLAILTMHDITDRKQAETALKESEARFQTIARNVPGMLYRYVPHADGSDTFTYVSSGAHDLLELEPSAILQDSRRVWDLFHPEDLPSLQESVEIAVKNSLPWQWEGRLITPSGQLKWIQGESRPEPTKSGIAWDGLLIDITERKQAEQALRESEEWARLAIQVGRLGGWRLHLDTNFVEMDERMREIWGEPEDAVMVPLAKVLERMHPDDRERVARAVNAAIDPKSTGTYEIEYRLIWDDGTERWVLAKGQAQFEGEGNSRRTVGFFGTLLDITERMRVENERKQAEAELRQSEERYRYLAESIPQLVWTADGAGALLDMNQRWSNFTGLTLTRARTEGWEAVVHPQDVPTLAQNWTIAQQSGSNYQAEGRMRRADGVYRWHLHQAVPLKNAQGQVIKWFGTATDIEDQKQLEQQRLRLLEQEQAAREQAEAANRIKDEFLAVLSHELRSPLNPILGWSKLLQTHSFDKQGRDRALQTIERNAKLQAQLIEDLLDVSRILRGKMVLNVGAVNLVTVVESALETVRLAAEAKQIRIQTRLPDDGIYVSGDAARLQQVVWNLLSNAVKFTPEQGQITVRLDRVDSNAQIQVQDTGKGISLAFLPYVFDYFCQEDGKTTRKFGGLGLGLAIVRHLAELHGGTVKAESPGEGQGATFTIQLPLMTAKLKSEEPLADVSQTVDLSQLRILIVDDEIDMRALGQIILEQQGAQVTIAASAAEALFEFDRQPPDLLISDIGMPGMDGYMLIRQIRQRSLEQGGRVPAIALTAYAAEYDQQQALAAGFQQHLAKPIEPEMLINAIAALFNRQGGQV